MANYDPPYINSNIFNVNYFTDLDGSLSLVAADLRYLKLTGGVVHGLTSFSNSLNVIGTLSINGNAIDLSLISDITAGTPAPNKALSLDASGNINGALNCTQLNTNLASSGLSWQSIAGSSTIALNHTLNGSALLGSITNTSFGFLTNNIERMRILNNGNVGIGTASASYKLDVNGDINTNTTVLVSRTSDGTVFDSECGSSNMVIYHFNNGDAYLGTSTANSLVFQTSNVARMAIDQTGAIGGISILTGAALIASATLSVNGIDVESNLAPLIGITPGTATASKALIVDSNKDISGLGIISSHGIALTPTNYTLTSPNISGCLWRTNSSRLSAFREIDTNNWSWGYSGGGVWNDILVMSNSTYRITVNGDLNYTGSLRSSGTVVLDSSRNLIVNGITAADITATTITAPLASIRDNSQTHNTRIEYLSLGRSSSGSDHGAWSFQNYYSTSTQGDSNYCTFGPKLRTGLTTGWGMVMTQNGNVSFQDRNTNGSAGGFRIQANIIACVDILGGNTRTVGAGSGELRANATPAVFNGSTVSTRIGLFVENAIWCSDRVYVSSDKRLKRDIEPIPLDEAKKLLNINAVSYRWKKDKFDDFTKSIGLLAQDVIENGLDKLVSYCPNDNKKDFPEGYNFGIEYNRVSIYLLELIKDLYVQIEELKNEILLLKDTTKKNIKNKSKETSIT